MGTMRFEGLLITGQPSDNVGDDMTFVHNQAVLLFGKLVSPIMSADSNGYLSFAIFPSGSKFGWSRWQEHQENIAKMAEILSKTNLRWVAVRYGDELGDASILRSSDLP